MKISQLMSKPVKTCHPDEPVSGAAGLMWDGDVGCVAVVDSHGQLVGVITDRDICMAAYTRGEPLHQIPVSAAMNKHVVTCRPDDNDTEVAALMGKHLVRRIPVVDDAQRPVGMLSINDLAIAAAGNGSAKKAEVSQQTVTSALAAICSHRAPTLH